MTTRFTIYTVVFAIFSSLVIADDSCRFENANGVIDLTSLGRTDGTAAYPDKLPSGSNYKYSYNPCRPFSEGTNCKNVSVCQVSTDGLFTFTLGTQESASWTSGATPDTALSLTYSNNEKIAIVELICSTNGSAEFEVLGENPQNIYRFRLTHECACWNGCSNTTTVTTPQTTSSSQTTTSSSIVTDPCRFENANGVIDLTSLGRTDGTAAYSDVIPSTSLNYKYSYNPCRPFSEGTNCKNVSVCQVSTDGLFTFTLGTQESASWSSGATPDTALSLTYSNNEKIAIVELICSTNGSAEFEVLGENPQNIYRFRLTHECACWNGCSNTTTVTTPQTTSSSQTTTSSSIVTDPCRFENANGVIDLTSLGRTDGTAAYPDKLPSGSNYKYSYNPCRPFSEGTNCKNVSVCQVSTDGLFTFTLGTQESASWTSGATPDTALSLTYSNNEKIAIVELICSTNGSAEFEVLGENPQNIYRFRLTHECACWNGCSNTTPVTTPQTTTVTRPTTTSSSVITDPCRFENANGVIDLTSLGRTDGTAAYLDVVPSTSLNYKYSYNPCTPFSEGTDCKNVAACQVSTDGQFTFSLGTQESALWIPGATPDNATTLAYYSREKVAFVELLCSTNGSASFEVLDENPQNFYRFRLIHECACWNGCSNTTTVTSQTPTSSQTTTTTSRTGGGNTIRGGTLFTVLSFVLASVYFIELAAY